MKEIEITDIEGFQVGQAEGQKVGTGCTVILYRDGAVAEVNVGDGGPATGRTDLLYPINMVQEAYAVMLSGGSAYGLNAVSGAIRYLEEHGAGFDMQVVKVPIVRGANSLDLSIGDTYVRPDKETDYAACVDAESDTVLEGNHGTGTGASVGKLLGFKHTMRSGIGTYGIQVGDLQITAIVAVNACGDVVGYEVNELLTGVYDSHSGFVLKVQGVLFQRMNALRELPEGNTTIGCFVANAKLDKAQHTKIAGVAYDGYARTIHPVHTMSDGDSIFILSSGEVEVMADAVGVLTTRVMVKATKRTVLRAESAYGLPAHSDVIYKQPSITGDISVLSLQKCWGCFRKLPWMI